MSQVLSQKTLKLLEKIREQGKINVYSFIKQFYRHESYRKIYTHIYQLEKRGYLEKYKLKDLEYLRASDKGITSLDTFKRERDGKWKMIIFDIPESKRSVRDYLRTKLKQLGFKRWQNSIWITPYRLPVDVVVELKELSKRHFVRLITVEHINNESGLKELF